jgi:hypothetical protein
MAPSIVRVKSLLAALVIAPTIAAGQPQPKTLERTFIAGGDVGSSTARSLGVDWY